MAQKKQTAGKTAQEKTNGEKFAAVFNNAKTEADGKKVLEYMIAGFTAAFNARFPAETTPAKGRKQAKTKETPAKTKAAPKPRKQEKAETDKAEVTPVAETDKEAIKKLNLEYHDYSEKSFAITGDTKPVKDIMKRYKGRFNAWLKCGAGWVFSKKCEAEVREALAI